MVASIGHYIDNKPVAGKSGRTGDITNPATGEVTAKVAFASTEAKATLAVTSPVAGLVMSPVRPLLPATGLLSM